MIQKIEKMLICLILFFSLSSSLYAAPCEEWALLLPIPRTNAGMAFDSTTNQTLLFGGFSNGSSLNDTWSWDGTKWTQLFPEHSPSPRQFPRLAYDATTQTIILFGGSSNFGSLNDTWSWDGTDWTELSPANSPPARALPTLAFDSNTNQMILFGGISFFALNDTWNWNGSNWIQLTPATTPPARAGAVMAFDANSNQLILFSGNGAGFLTDTWNWDGTNWNLLTPATTPPGRQNAVMDYDPSGTQLILFGGTNGGGTLGDTWSWDGTDWTQLSPATSPPGRFSAVFALDANDNLILFGGNDGITFGDTWSWDGNVNDWSILNDPPSQRAFSTFAFYPPNSQLILFGGVAPFSNIYFNDTFNWNGTAWIELFPATSPSPRAFSAMDFDPTNNALILFGGFDDSQLDDTWSWDGTDWTELFPATSPSARSAFRLVFDTATNQMILFGGSIGFPSVLGDTWNWNGTTWTQLSPATSPSARSNYSMAFDSATNQLILFGGIDSDSNFLGDTWSWDGTNWTQLFPTTSPPARANGVMAFDPGTNQLILFGGTGDDGDFFDTWAWDGNTWSQVLPNNFQIFPNGVVMASDPATDQMVLFDFVSSTWNFDSFPAFFVVATPGNQSICSGSTVSIALTSPLPGATFTWTASADGVTGASDGSGPLISQTLSVNTPANGTVTYTITPTEPSGCQGLPITVIVSVNLDPFGAATPLKQTIITGQTTSVALSSNVPGTTFSWTATASDVSGATSGSGALIAQTLTTTTNKPGTVIYTITPSAPSGCPGSVFIAIVTVLPADLFPPTDVCGFQKCSSGLKINVITWRRPASGERPVAYRIYRDAGLTKLAAKIRAGHKLEFEDDCRHSMKTNIYYLIAVDENGNQSTAVEVVIRKGQCKRCH